MLRGWRKNEGYYYDLRTGEVTWGKRRGALSRMGPYESAEEAERAMERVRERNEAWLAEEEAEREADEWDKD